jgi:hypothetical protein
VREQERPAAADPVMEFDFAFGGFSLEIRGHSANLESHFRPHVFQVAGEFAMFSIAGEAP